MTNNYRGRYPPNPLVLGGTLTKMERDVVELLPEGLGNKQIADRLGISVSTVQWRLKNVFLKYGTDSRTVVAVKFALAEQAAKRLDLCPCRAQPVDGGHE